jgi:Protein of unknown function (DUF3489)
MSTLSAKKSSNPKSAAPKKTRAKSPPAPRRKGAPIAIVAKTPPQPDETPPKALAAHEPQLEGVTKQELILTLLSRPEGASIEEMMQATDWQQHSVRGFLAGTVKKKLGFALTSSKANTDVRRYRIETRRGR